MELKPGERIDDLGRRGYRIIQDPKKFCFGIDAALISWFARIGPGENAADLGTGTGIIPLLMDARNACGTYTGLEIMPDMAEMAGRSVQLNHAEDHIRIVCGDLKEASALLGKGSFDVVTSNPPYMPAKNGLINPDPEKAAARHELLCTLEDVIREAALLLKPRGRFYLVHRPARLTDILTRMKAFGLAPARRMFVHPFADKEASLVLISATRGGRDILKTEPPVIIYRSPGVYTERVLTIYQEEKASLSDAEAEKLERTEPADS